MWLRPGNLVKHRSGGPIMMVDLGPLDQFMPMRPLDPECSCVWVENGVKKGAAFPVSHLQPVYADGTPRNYDEETHKEKR
jgi:hypothetical protein